MEKIKILGITGPSGCGKDTAARWLAETYPTKYQYIKLHTTRPQRNKEDDGYIFCEPGDFLKQVLNGDMLNAQEFRGWYYGLSKDALYETYINVIPMNNEMIMQMLDEKERKDYDLKLLYLYTDDKERLLHILNREEEPDCDEICRRFLSDKTDYNYILAQECEYSIMNNYNKFFFKTLLRNANACFEDDYDKIV